jgi:3'(2'), 5'-bisphosphate nucleotidase
LNYQQELDLAIFAVREAAAVCAAVQAELGDDVLQKNDKSPVTVADFSSQAVVCRNLMAGFNDDPVIGEEDSAQLRQPGNAVLLSKVVDQLRRMTRMADPDSVCHWIDHGRIAEYSPRFWTLDPIDGTKGFLRKEQYAVALALIVFGEVAVAALACPGLKAGEGAAAAGAIFSAVRGGGAFVEPLDRGAPRRPIRVTANADPSVARFCESVESGHSSHDEAAMIAHRLGITAEPLRMDSQAKYAAVAMGMADIYLRLPTQAGYVEKIWDHAAGLLVVEEAGGRVTDVAGKPLDFTLAPTLRANRGVIVTNGKLHDRVLAAVGAVLR